MRANDQGTLPWSSNNLLINKRERGIYELVELQRDYVCRVDMGRSERTKCL